MLVLTANEVLFSSNRLMVLSKSYSLEDDLSGIVTFGGDLLVLPFLFFYALYIVCTTDTSSLLYLAFIFFLPFLGLTYGSYVSLVLLFQLATVLDFGSPPALFLSSCIEMHDPSLFS